MEESNAPRSPEACGGAGAGGVGGGGAPAGGGGGGGAPAGGGGGGGVGPAGGGEVGEEGLSTGKSKNTRWVKYFFTRNIISRTVLIHVLFFF